MFLGSSVLFAIYDAVAAARRERGLTKKSEWHLYVSFVTICVFLAAQSLCCCARAFSSYGERYSPAAVHELQSVGSGVVAHGLIAAQHVESSQTRD